ncbi:phospho-N-acetylmuramoyl-pentapeptide-transferase [Planctomyces sp. SH-PL14]|uniref:phospho-N-acetylmuramoyl-pentapeptide- transferase n=1 Tax=Planctomyces sp. SH-PL14 TaxID=1632864 RepID=UPI00078EDF33|nr:phospho-N-acetylmuramoyl-pentapeptide-transferase [Planctomyces sp. SH-PL14]AMV21823.1 Phospho-N-acetylmuramoyl-pentapeptide-transferase [Planctomyces sp. SH-PL14]
MDSGGIAGALFAAALVPGSLTTRIALATLGAFLAVLIAGPFGIRWLRSRFGERIDSASARLNELHAAKQNTPSMGGLLLIGATCLVTPLLADLANPFVPLLLFVLLTFGALGAADDWIKIRRLRRGLTPRQKFVVQVVLGLIATWWLQSAGQSRSDAGTVVLPLGNVTVALGTGFLIWGALVVVGSSNGVNLTDGLDGLAAGTWLISGTCIAVLTYLAGHAEFARHLGIPSVPGSGEITVVLGAMLGAVLGFLWFNCHPAQVFMGDTGALSLGAVLGLAALAVKQELLLIFVGGVFVIETLSVFFQMGTYRLIGRKPLRCSPLHNHFVFRGDPETRIVTRFWIAAILLAIAGLATLKLRTL